MLFLLSPAKTLDFDTPARVAEPTTPQFLVDSAALIAVLKTYSVADIAALMNVSESLATLNVGRYAAWRRRFKDSNAKPAVVAFNGDVYEGLAATSLDAAELGWAQQHVLILSGLYGVLRPLDRMQPYRLEMGTRLATSRGSDLYAFWGGKIATYLNKVAAKDATPVIVNLASREYFKVVDPKRLKARVVECVFEDWNSGAYKVIGFHAKRARGLMARYAIQRRLVSPNDLRGFDLEGYGFDATESSPHRLVFRRSRVNRE